MSYGGRHVQGLTKIAYLFVVLLIFQLFSSVKEKKSPKPYNYIYYLTCMYNLKLKSLFIIYKYLLFINNHISNPSSIHIAV